MASKYSDSLPKFDNSSAKDLFARVHQHRDVLLNLIVTGKSGEGKSPNINTLIKHSSNQKYFFDKEESLDSVTKRYNECTIDLFDADCHPIGLLDMDTMLNRNAEFEFGAVLAAIDAHKATLKF